MSKDLNPDLSSYTVLAPSPTSSCLLRLIFTHLRSQTSPGSHQFHVAGHCSSLLNGMQPLREKILIVPDRKVCRELINYSKRMCAPKALLTGVHFLGWHNFFTSNCCKARANANPDASSTGSLAYHQGYIIKACLTAKAITERQSHKKEERWVLGILAFP